MTTATPSSSSSQQALGGFQAWVVIICASLFFFYEFVQMNMFNSINANLMQTFGITATKVSNLSAFYFYADVIFLFPAGIILDHFSTRKLIVAALSLCTIATIAFSFADSYAMAAAMRTLSGIGAAFCFLSAMRLATRWFPTEKLALATGVIVTMAMLGGMVAQTPIALLNEHLGWRHTVFLDGFLGVIFIALILWKVQDFPPNSSLQQRSEATLTTLGFWPSIIAVWRNKQNWLGGCYTSFLNLPILIIGALWGSQFLIQVHHLSTNQAGTVMMMLFLGTIIGSPIVGWLSDKIQSRKTPMIICAIISIFLILLIMYLPHLTLSSCLLLFLLLGFITSGQIISYPLIAESNTNALAGSATGWAAVLIMSGGAIGQPFFGWLLDKHWDGLKLHNIPVYSAADYHFAFMIFPIMFFVALLVTFFMKETHGKSLVD
jgi:MFS family permease